MGNPSYCGHSGSRFFASLTNPRPYLQNIGVLTVAVLLFLDLSALAQGNGNGQNNGNAWGTQGNSGQGNWLGTSDDTDLILKSFGQERLRLKADGDMEAQGLFKADRMKVLGLTELDSVRTVFIRANRITSQNPGDTLIFFGDNSIVMDHSNDHIYAVHTNGTKDMRIQCQGFLQQGQSGNNHTMFNSTRGNVGIGVGNYGTLPTEKLHVNGNVRITGSKLHVSSAGDIGIGTSSPQARLDVKNTSNTSAFRVQSDGTVIAGQLAGANTSGRLCVGDPNHYIKGMFGKGLSLSTFLAEDALFIQEVTGKVGIGLSPNHVFGEGLLEVNGTIRSKEVVVDVNNWYDHVFTDTFELRSISELEEYIKQNGHLPDIPTTSTVKADGVQLGELNALLLKKIEELTLYVINLQKQNDALHAEFESLKTGNQ